MCYLSLSLSLSNHQSNVSQQSHLCGTVPSRLPAVTAGRQTDKQSSLSASPRQASTDRGHAWINHNKKKKNNNTRTQTQNKRSVSGGKKERQKEKNGNRGGTALSFHLSLPVARERIRERKRKRELATLARLRDVKGRGTWMLAPNKRLSVEFDLAEERRDLTHQDEMGWDLLWIQVGDHATLCVWRTTLTLDIAQDRQQKLWNFPECTVAQVCTLL